MNKVSFLDLKTKALKSAKGITTNTFKSVKTIINSEFFKNVFVFMSGTFLAQIVTIGSSPFITRLFTPENFGIFALFIAIIRPISNISSLCYERAILLPKKKEDAINVFFLSIAITLSVAIVTALIILFSKGKILKIIGNESFSFWLLLIPLVILLQGTENIIIYWRTRNKNFKTLSSVKVLQASASAAIKIAIGFFIGAYTGGLIAGFVIGLFISILILSSRPKNVYSKEFYSPININKIKELASKYKQFPIFATWNNLLYTFSGEIVIFMLTFLFNPAVVGFYSLGNRILIQPITLISQSVRTVFFQKFAQDYSHNSNVKRSFQITILSLIITGFPPFLFLSIFGKPVFIFVFGQEWANAGLFAQILSPWFFLLYISSPADVVFEVFQKQKVKLKFIISMLIMRFFALYIGYFVSKDQFITLGAFVLVNIIFQSLIIFTAHIMVGREDLKRLGKI